MIVNLHMKAYYYYFEEYIYIAIIVTTCYVLYLFYLKMCLSSKLLRINLPIDSKDAFLFSDLLL